MDTMSLECSGRGVCKEPGYCACIIGYSGSYCETPVDVNGIQMSILPESGRARIHFVWGIEPMPARNIFDGRPTGASLDEGQQRILLDGSSQELIAELCERLSLLPPWRSVGGSLNCPILDLKRSQLSSGLPWPLPPDDVLPGLRNLGLFSNLIGIQQDEATGVQSIIWIAATVDPNVRPDSSPDEIRELAEYFEGLSVQANEQARSRRSLLEGWQTSVSYIWMEAIGEAISGTAGCVISGAILTAATLLLLTGSVGLTLATLAGVISVLICFVGYLVEREYELGVIEAIATTIFIGFACDYCVHVAQIHRSSDCSFRRTLEHAGPSLYGAALTTTASAAPLLACQIVLFKQMGEFICVCTVFSLLVAITLIAPIVHLTHLGLERQADRNRLKASKRGGHKRGSMATSKHKQSVSDHQAAIPPALQLQSTLSELSTDPSGIAATEAKEDDDLGSQPDTPGDGDGTPGPNFVARELTGDHGYQKPKKVGLIAEVMAETDEGSYREFHL